MARTDTPTKKDPSAEDLAEQLEALRADVSKLAATMTDMGRASGARLGEAARAHAERAGNVAQSGVDAARAQAHEWEQQANDFVTRQPATALGIAAGVGFLVGLITARR
ncbi:DUF883 family protein [Pontibaca salina]|uniref:DUF883 family protein n=1 Tax=Pontibaca salina TaxID=2795731 RepID=A0A934HRV7_9RHOB|nr:DUF883 family protein [Pontibaca salina]MBI6629415.1 DUF883 family protein [Pontibaca salina]